MFAISENLATVEKLQRDARRARKSGDWETAEKSLEGAVSILQQEWDKKALDGPPGTIASEEVRTLAGVLADTLGSLAGIQRRRQNNTAALENYRRGMEIEENPRYLVTSTYNRIQWLVAGITMGALMIDEKKIQTRIAETVSTLKRQVATTRRDDPWALADLVLMAALSDDQALAEDAFRSLKALNPIRDVYSSGLPVLEQLSVVLPHKAGISEAVKWYRPFVEPPKANG